MATSQIIIAPIQHLWIQAYDTLYIISCEYTLVEVIFMFSVFRQVVEDKTDISLVQNFLGVWELVFSF